MLPKYNRSAKLVGTHQPAKVSECPLGLLIINISGGLYKLLRIHEFVHRSKPHRFAAPVEKWENYHGCTLRQCKSGKVEKFGRGASAKPFLRQNIVTQKCKTCQDKICESDPRTCPLRGPQKQKAP